MIGQVFIYIVTIVVVGLILLFGYNAIMTVKGKSDDIIISKFKSDISSMVEIVSSDFGSVKIKFFELPAKYTKACFVKNYPDFPILGGTGYPVMEDSVNDEAKKNLFLVEDMVRESFFVGDIDIDGGVLCFDTANNRIQVRFEGKGNHALLSEP